MIASQSQLEYDAIRAAVKLIPEAYAILVITKKGELYSYLASEDCAKYSRFSRIEQIAKLFSSRLYFGEFENELGEFQLELTTFENHYMFGRFIPNDKILLIIISKNLHDPLEEKIDQIIDVARKYFGSPDKIEELKEMLKPIPPIPVDVQKDGEKLISKKYILVASSEQPTKHKNVRLFGYHGD